jgi:MYXO-CTERM domain-containing protein
MWIKLFLLLFFFACVGLPAAAYQFGHQNGGGPWTPPVVHSAPGPEAGVGLPFLAVGGLLWLQRRKRRAAQGGNQGR